MKPVIDLLAICAFNARYADVLDSDELERWPEFFTEDCHYRVTNLENYREGLAAGLIYADSRAMLHDRISALREANIYERQSYRHLLGMPLILDEDKSRTPFMVARVMATGETFLFSTGRYEDRFAVVDGALLLASRVVVCDSSSTDTLLALPL